jgi:hypothetical protein
VKEYCLGCYWPFVDTMASTRLMHSPSWIWVVVFQGHGGKSTRLGGSSMRLAGQLQAWRSSMRPPKMGAREAIHLPRLPFRGCSGQRTCQHAVLGRTAGFGMPPVDVRQLHILTHSLHVHQAPIYVVLHRSPDSTSPRGQVNNALSDEFWCEHRGVLNGTVEVPKTETALVDMLHTDVSFVACMENVRAPRERERGREDPVGGGKGLCLQTRPLRPGDAKHALSC